MIKDLSRMFVDTFGQWTQIVFLIGAGAVLFKTLYLSSAGNGRLITDFLSLSGFVHFTRQEQRASVIQNLSLLIPVIALGLFFTFGEPRRMVVIGGFGQALMLPIITGATVYFRYRKLDRRLLPSLWLDLLLWIAFASITVVAIFALKNQIENLRKPAPATKKAAISVLSRPVCQRFVWASHFVDV